MGYCVDSRVDPFNAVTQYKTITEYHIVPATAPYIVRLGEVANLDSPSSLVVKDSSGTLFTEVANIPEKGEVFPDYYCEFNKKDMATGLLLFNQADAGKPLTVTYKGVGSLTQSLANRRSRYIVGRGSGALGNVRITENTTLSGIYNYESLIINPGVTVTVNNYCVIRCCEAFINYGTIRATNNAVNPINDNKSGSGGYTDSLNTPNNWYAYTTWDVPASKGGCSATYGYHRTTHVYPIRRYANADNVWQYGSIEDYVVTMKGIPRILGLPGIQGACGGACGVIAGTGGKGGGSVSIFSKELLNTGIINCSGYNGGNAPSQWHSRYGYRCGGGSGGNGGAIILVANTLRNTGGLYVSPGSGGAYSDKPDETWNRGFPSAEEANGKSGESGIVYTLVV